jgi:AhpD family alkylhydroperoxidase
MVHNPEAFYAGWPAAMGLAKAKGPDLGKAFGPFFKELMKDGAVSAKHKELIALGIAVAVKCEACIYAHVEKCMQHGASGAEVMEAAGVAVMMGGGPAYTTCAQVAAAVEYLEKKKGG